MRRKYIFPILIVSVVIGLGGYTLLGGWRAVEYQTVQQEEPYALVGLPYAGDYDDPQVERNFFAIKEYLEKGTLSGDFAVVYWKHPEDFEGEVEQMMGVLYPASQVPGTLPQDVEVRPLPGTEKMVQATLTSHVAVMKAPGRVREGMREHAAAEGLTLAGYSIEKLLSDWHLEVEMPVATQE